MQAVVTTPTAPPAATVFVPDARAVVPPGMSTSNPAHPVNLQKRLASLTTQTAADTKYDPAPPPYVEQVAAAAEGFCLAADHRTWRHTTATFPATPLLVTLAVVLIVALIVRAAPAAWRTAALIASTVAASVGVVVLAMYPV